MTTPAEHIRDILLQVPAVVTLTGDWQCKISRFVNTPGQPIAQVAVMDTGGREALPHLLLDEPTVQVMVRGNQDGYSAAATKARDVKDRLLGIPSVTMGNGDRIDGILMMGDINSLGYDETDRPLFSLNFRLYLEPAASSLTHRTSL